MTEAAEGAQQPAGGMVGAGGEAASTTALPPAPPQLPSPPTAPAGLYASPADKPFLGGYRHSRSGAVFHHAATQTPGGELVQPRRMRQPVCAATQTGRPRSRAVQCPRDAAAQCGEPDAAGARVLPLTGTRGTCAVAGVQLDRSL